MFFKLVEDGPITKFEDEVQLPFPPEHLDQVHQIRMLQILPKVRGQYFFKGCPGWGANPGPLNLIYLLIFTNLPLSHSGSPYIFFPVNQDDRHPLAHAMASDITAAWQ
jgi:hypothetical protein